MNVLRIAAALLVLALPALAEDAAAKAAKEKKKNEADLAKVDAEIKKKPDDVKSHTLRAQLLAKLARFDEAGEEGLKTVPLYEKAKDATAFFVLETIDLGNVIVEVRVNMGPRERKPPDMGIVRPIAFRVMSKDAKGAAKDELRTINYELAYMGGEPDPGGLGEEKPGGGHSLYAMLKKEDKFASIRDKALELVKKMHPPEEKK